MILQENPVLQFFASWGGSYDTAPILEQPGPIEYFWKTRRVLPF